AGRPGSSCRTPRSAGREADATVGPVAERLVRRATAPAEGDPRVLTQNFAVVVDDAHLAAQEQRSVRARLDGQLARRLLLRPAVQAAVMERAGRALLDRCRDLIGVGSVQQDPRP